MTDPLSPFASRLAALRQEMTVFKLDALLVPMTDAFQNEYIPDSERRVGFLSGFTGSAGFIVVLKDQAAFFTDGRYTLQAARQIPQDLFALFDTAATPPILWLRDQAKLGFKIGFDPSLHTADGLERLTKILEKTGAEIVPLPRNLVDAIWIEGRPAAPAEPVVPYETRYAGKDSAEKRADVAEALRKDNVEAAVITDPASVAWLFNVRGNDVPHTPLPLSYALIKADGKAAWFVDPRKRTPGLDAHLGVDVQTLPLTDFEGALRTLGAGRTRVRVDTSETSYRFVEALRQAGAVLDKGRDPTALLRACKNATEMDGMRAAHRRDGVALVTFLAWLDAEAPQGNVTELSAEAKLEECRRTQSLFKGPSFDTIAGFGPNGAIVHYRATEATNLTLQKDSLFLLDSGAQYLDGTTDVTRTVVIGKASDAMRQHFTRVLKGHIHLSRIRFPEGVSGSELDVLARQFLWEKGLDYAHGTGHGVGCYLVVHEGPQAISRRSTEPLRANMVLSNEPGFYAEGDYGIRHENLLAVVPQPEISTQGHAFLGFEPLTLAPFDRRGIDVVMLTASERAWLDTYHARVWQTLHAHLDPKTAHWLEKATAPL